MIELSGGRKSSTDPTESDKGNDYWTPIVLMIEFVIKSANYELCILQSRLKIDIKNNKVKVNGMNVLKIDFQLKTDKF